jgi:hypothetical protein
MWEALLILFAFGGFWFWSLLGLASLLLIVCLEKDSGFVTTVVFAVTLAVMLLLGNAGWLTWVFQNPLYFGLGVLGYLAVGVGWGVGKWWIYVRDCALRYRRARREWLERPCSPQAPEDGLDVSEWLNARRTEVLTGRVKKAWQRYVRDHCQWKKITKPLASRYKGQIITWMTYWPWSALWTLINDPVRRFFRWAYEQLSGTLQAISNRAFQDIENEMEDDA